MLIRSGRFSTPRLTNICYNRLAYLHEFVFITGTVQLKNVLRKALYKETANVHLQNYLGITMAEQTYVCGK